MCSSYGRSWVPVVSILSISHSKKGNLTQNLIEMLKSDLNLIRIKFIELNLGVVSKFHLSHASS